MTHGRQTPEREKLLSLLEKMEDTFPMEFAPPCSLTERPAGLPADLFVLYSITDGMEIDVPGTVILPLEEVSLWPEEPSCGEPQRLCFGHMNFGDFLCIDENGTVFQMDIEDGSEFLRWDSLLDFLQSEYESGVKTDAL